MLMTARGEYQRSDDPRVTLYDRPPCFTEKDWIGWLMAALEDRNTGLARPCQDCLPNWQQRMLKLGRCRFTNLQPYCIWSLRKDHSGIVYAELLMRLPEVNNRWYWDLRLKRDIEKGCVVEDTAKALDVLKAYCERQGIPYELVTPELIL